MASMSETVELMGFSGMYAILGKVCAALPDGRKWFLPCLCVRGTPEFDDNN